MEDMVKAATELKEGEDKEKLVKHLPIYLRLLIFNGIEIL